MIKDLVISIFIFLTIFGLFMFFIFSIEIASRKIQKDRYENTKYTIITKDKEYKHADRVSHTIYKGGSGCNFNYNGQEITIVGEYTLIKEKPETEKTP